MEGRFHSTSSTPTRTPNTPDCGTYSALVRTAAALVAVSFLLLGACTGDSAAGTGTAIRDVTVIDAVSGVRENQTVIFDGDAITWVGPADDAPPARATIDGAGKYLIPGLWDMHVHLTSDERFTGIMPASFLRYGVTSVRDTGGLLRKLVPAVDAMRNSGQPSPRVFFSGPLLDGEFVVYDGISGPEVGTPILSPEQAAASVAEIKAAGASFIKIYEMVSPDVFDALVAAASEHDMPIAAHVPLSMQASDAGPAVDSMEHLRNVEIDCTADSDALLSVRRKRLENPDGLGGMALRASLHDLQRIPAIQALDEDRCAYVLSRLANTIQVPTLGLNTIAVNPVFDREDWAQALLAMPVAIREEWQQPPSWLPADRQDWDTTFGTYSLAMVARMHRAGIPIGAGTDTPLAHAIPGFSLLYELELLVAAGLTPLEALGAATVEPAAFFSLLEEMGSVDAGKRADLVLLNTNPTIDIRNLQDISLVISKGSPVPRQGRGTH